MLKVERLTKTYPSAGGALTVLREVSFDLEPGASLAIVGPSGSGKTTLLGLCAGLDRPTSGQVALAGETIGDMDEDERARVRNDHVGFVFFRIFSSFPRLPPWKICSCPWSYAARRAVRRRPRRC